MWAVENKNPAKAHTLALQKTVDGHDVFKVFKGTISGPTKLVTEFTLTDDDKQSLVSQLGYGSWREREQLR